MTGLWSASFPIFSTRFFAFKQPTKLLFGAAGDLRARRIGGRKLVAPMVGLAGIDDGDRMGHVAGGALFRREARIGRRVPRPLDELDRFLRVGPGEHRPDQMLE